MSKSWNYRPALTALIGVYIQKYTVTFNICFWENVCRLKPFARTTTINPGSVETADYLVRSMTLSS